MTKGEYGKGYYGIYKIMNLIIQKFNFKYLKVPINNIKVPI